jgi:hypothetical protein
VKAKNWRADAGQYSVELGRSVEDIAARATVNLTRSLQVPVSQ